MKFKNMLWTGYGLSVVAMFLTHASAQEKANPAPVIDRDYCQNVLDTQKALIPKYEQNNRPYA